LLELTHMKLFSLESDKDVHQFSVNKHGGYYC